MTITLAISTLAVDTELIDAADVTTVDNELLAFLNAIVNGAQESESHLFDEITTPSNPSSNQWLLYFTEDGLTILDDAGTETLVAPQASSGISLSSDKMNCRLSLTSGTPVTTSDVTAATHVYVTPYKGNLVTIYNGSGWDDYVLSEIDIDLTGATANKNYDVFIYVSSGSVVAEKVVWTDDATRATALTKQDGRYVKNGTVTHRYVGTFRTTGTTGQTEDSVTKRYVYNYHNRVERYMIVTESTDSWTYTVATWRSFNNSTSNRVSFVIGVAEDAISARAYASTLASTVVGEVAIGLDSTSSPSGLYTENKNAANSSLMTEYFGNPSAGYHYLQMLEYSSGSTTTFYGDNGAGVPCVSGMNARMAA